MARIFSRGLPSAGVFAGPFAWFVAQSSKYAVVPWTCANKFQLAHPITVLAFIIILFGAWLSWRALKGSDGSSPSDPKGGEPRHFLAALGVGMAALFGLLILLQGSAALVVDACDR